MQFHKEEPRERIRALAITLISGVMAAVLLTLVGLYYYGTTGSSVETNEESDEKN